MEMKHLKSYQLFESREVIMAGILNAMRNRNIELYKELIQQHSEHVDFQMIVDAIIPSKKTPSDFTFTVQVNLYLPYLNYIPFEYLSDVKHLIITNYYMENLEGIESLKNLESLSLYGNNLTDLSLLSGLTKLKTLDLTKNKLTNLNGIDSLVNLKKLVCVENKLTELDVSYFPKLEYLECSQNKLTVIYGLETLDVLYSLECHNNKLTSLAGVQYLPKLRRISTMTNPLPDVVIGFRNDVDKIKEYYANI